MFIARTRGTTAAYLITNSTKAPLADLADCEALSIVLGPPIELSPATLASFTTQTPVWESESDDIDDASDDM